MAPGNFDTFFFSRFCRHVFVWTFVVGFEVTFAFGTKSAPNRFAPILLSDDGLLTVFWENLNRGLKTVVEMAFSGSREFAVLISPL